MAWDVAYTDEFGGWWEALNTKDQERVVASVMLLETFGPNLGFPHSSQIKGSRVSGMRELRVQSRGKPLRVLYAFDPRRTAILLIGGDKRVSERWYTKMILIAERIYEEYLKELGLKEPPDGTKI